MFYYSVIGKFTRCSSFECFIIFEVPAAAKIFDGLKLENC